MSLETFPSRVGRRWELTGAAFQRLLSALGSDPERAALGYENLRERTIGLLEWWGSPRAEDLADETLDRVARRLEEGSVVPAASLGAFVRGVARLVFYDSLRDRTDQLDGERELAAAEETGDLEAELACLDGCLASASADDRSVILRYYASEKRYATRQGIAAELGISMTALRIRMCRLRARLEECVSACLGGR